MSTIPAFIAVDGPDGSGKSTVTFHIIQKLNSLHIPTHTSMVLQGGEAGRAVYKRMFSKKKHSEEDLSFILGMATCIQETYEDRILPAIEGGFVFVSDRYTPSYYAYQVVASNSSLAESIHTEMVRKMTRRPDLYIYLDVDVDISIQRLVGRGGKSDILDQKARDFKEAVIRGYRADFAESPVEWRVKINANQPIEDVLKDVDKQIDRFIALRQKYDK